MTTKEDARKFRHLVSMPALDCSVEVYGHCGYGYYGGVDNNAGNGGPTLGCHAQLASSISLIPDWATIKSLKTGKSILIKYDRWGNMDAPKADLQNKIITFLKTYEVPEKEQNRIFRQVAESFNSFYLNDGHHYGPKKAGMPSGPSIVIMSDNINSWTPEFNKSSGIPDHSKIRFIKTSDFIQWLVREKFGVVFGSPVTRNQFHQDPENFSMVQAWFWIPPNFAKHIVPESYFVSGLENAPSKEDWYKQTKKDINKPDISNEELDKRLWRGGEFASHKKHTIIKRKAA